MQTDDINEPCKRGFEFESLYSYIRGEVEGYRVVSKKSASSYNFGVIRADGTLVIECNYSYIRNAVNGMFVFAIGGTWRNAEEGEMEVLGGPLGDPIQDFHLDGAKWGIIDIKGSILFEPFADFMQTISEGKVTYRVKDKYGILDLSTGTKRLTEYDFLSSFSKGLCCAGKKREMNDSGFWHLESHFFSFGFIKDDLSELIPCEYDDAARFVANGYIEVYKEKDRTRITFDLDGKVIDSSIEYHCYPSQDID